MKNEDKYLRQLATIFRPIAWFSIANSLKFSGVQQALKLAFLESANADFMIDGKKMTTSRVSLLTGLQRRDIAEYAVGSKELDAQSQLVRLHSHLRAHETHQIKLNDFEELTRSLYQDIHPRTFLDELLRLDLVSVDGDYITVHEKPFIDNNRLGSTKIFADNITAHLNVGVGNVLGYEPQLQQSVFATELHLDDANELEHFAREETAKLLQDINKRAIEMQKRRKGSHQIRFGSYFEKKGK